MDGWLDGFMEFKHVDFSMKIFAWSVLQERKTTWHICEFWVLVKLTLTYFDG